MHSRTDPVLSVNHFATRSMLTTSAPAPSFDHAWQRLPPDPSGDALHALLVQQLDAPSFAVPIAHPSTPGGKAYAQALFVPLCDRERIFSVLERLAQEGRLESFCTTGIQTDSGFGLVLVIRPDDPALASARPLQGADACPDGAP